MTTKNIVASTLLALSISTLASAGTPTTDPTTTPATDVGIVDAPTDPAIDTNVFANMAGDGSNRNWYLCKAAALATNAACLAVPVAADFIAGFAAGPVGILLLELTGLPAKLIVSCDDLYEAQIVGCWLNYDGTRGPGK